MSFKLYSGTPLKFFFLKSRFKINSVMVVIASAMLCFTGRLLVCTVDGWATGLCMQSDWAMYPAWSAAQAYYPVITLAEGE